MPANPYTILTIPCLSDNYAFLIGNTATNEATLIDVPEAAPINAVLAEQGWHLRNIVLTHHHPDHVQGLDDLTGRADAKVIGAKADAHRLPPLDLALQEGDPLDLLGLETQVLDVSGHTIGHLAFYIRDLDAAFTADSLMALGCGRLFEGTPAQMLESLRKLAALPPHTQIYSGHEYTTTNARFALTVDPNNTALQDRVDATAQSRQNGAPTVPSLLQLELDTNPFLRAHYPEIAAHLEMSSADELDVFTEIRHRRNVFQ